MTFNPFRPDVIADPYPHYEELRRQGPLVFNEQFGSWMLTGFDDCSAVLKDLLVEIISAPEVYKKIVGMQMLVEGLAMGAFATFFQKINDPLGGKLRPRLQ